MLPNSAWHQISSFWWHALSPQALDPPPSWTACLVSPVSPEVPRTGIGKLNREGIIFSFAGHMVSVRDPVVRAPNSQAVCQQMGEAAFQ